SRAAFFLGCQPPATETLGVADDSIQFRRLDRLQDTLGFRKIGGERLLDQHRNAALDSGHDRINVQMIAGVTSGRLSNSTWLCVTKSASIFGPTSPARFGFFSASPIHCTDG